MGKSQAVQTYLAFLARTFYYLQKSRSTSAHIPTLQKLWAKETLDRLHIFPHITGVVSASSPLLLVGNHISYLEIPLLMSIADNISFVAKKELSRWPLFGRAAQAMKTIFVERGCQSSRSSAREAIREGFRQNRRIVIFPSGTTCLDESKQWRHGAFEIAAEMGVPVQPFRLRYTPQRRAAFIDDDFFITHLYNVARSPRIDVNLEFHEAQAIGNPQEDCQTWQNWAQQNF